MRGNNNHFTIQRKQSPGQASSLTGQGLEEQLDESHSRLDFRPGKQKMEPKKMSPRGHQHLPAPQRWRPVNVGDDQPRPVDTQSQNSSSDDERWYRPEGLLP